MNDRNERTISEQWNYTIERDGSLQLHRERCYCATAHFGRTSWYMRVARGIWVTFDYDELRVTEDVIFRTATEPRSVITHVVGAGREPR